jgi:hypothetical protein
MVKARLLQAQIPGVQSATNRKRTLDTVSRCTHGVVFGSVSTLPSLNVEQ